MEESERKSAKPAGTEAKEAPEHEPEACGEGGDDDADKLDVCSDKFDPLKALYSPTVTLPFPNIKCFNNVSEYESFLKGGRGRAKPENVEKRRLKATRGVADPERIERLKRLMVKNPVPEAEEGESSGRRRRRQRPVKNVLTRMSLCKGSPMGELFRCVEERIRVKVHIRTFKGLRGVCSGFVVAFDKFWNMAMVDVDETYREPLLGQALYHEKALTITRLFDKLKLQDSSEGDKSAKKHKTPRSTQTSGSSHPASGSGSSKPESTPSDADETKQDQRASQEAQAPEAAQKKGSQRYGMVRTRHVNQLFIRGENVILVNPQPL
ncbi:U7 snRNA-associated Sm-like protein LSm11 [Anabas testudineus]|uniref:Sm domain-containing protein n=1 Tax=Anabas testudineus TaxID=64144 RepID=A0A3Q1H396_ANATE|nr:U7 snRNA-associated Sm-like protein LSm11 [Anabas testudineus]